MSQGLRWMVLVVAVAVLGCGPGQPPPSAPSAVLKKPLPEFVRRTLNAGPIDTKRPGRVVVVKFFAKYCEPCKETLPAAQRMSLEYPDVTFIGVAVDEHQSDVVEMIETYGLSFPIVHDRGNVLAGRFRVNELPATFVADPRGTIRWVALQKTSEEDIEAAISWVRSGS